MMDADLAQLIEACKREERRAQHALYARFGAMMFSVSVRYTNSRADAEDVVQEAWVKVFRHLDSFSRNHSFEGWLRRIVVNTAITHYRKNLRHVHHLDIDEVHATPADLEAFKECEFTREELDRAIGRLPTGYGLVFNMYVIDGMKHKEISDLLGVDVNTSKSQLSRARKYLQEVLTHMSAVASPQQPLSTHGKSSI